MEYIWLKIYRERETNLTLVRPYFRIYTNNKTNLTSVHENVMKEKGIE